MNNGRGATPVLIYAGALLAVGTGACAGICLARYRFSVL